MSSYTIEINEKNGKAKNFLKFIMDYASDHDFIRFQKTPNIETRKAIDDARKGKVTKVKGVKELFNSIED